MSIERILKKNGRPVRKNTDNPPVMDPNEKSAISAESQFWTLRPPPDVRRLMARAIREMGRDKTFWISECIRVGLKKYAGKKDGGPIVLKG